jgi:hypothetical protein
MIRALLSLAFVLSFCNGKAYAQDVQYARQVIDTLCSSALHGRGYVSKGDRIAARYIKNEFVKLGLIPFNKDYFQPFKFSVNTFPKKMQLKVDGKTLLPGIDYLIDPASHKIKGQFRLYRVASTSIRGTRDMLKNRFLLVDKSEAGTNDEQGAMDMWITKPAGAKGVIMIEDNKLVWSVSRKQMKHPVFRVLRKSLPENPSEIEVRADACFRKKHSTQNVIGFIRGTQFPDSFIVFTAHYDHLGRMGRENIFPGANDNASGVAMLLNLAQHYSKNPLPFSVAFIAFAGEEAGLLGSEYFVKNPVFPLNKIRFLLNMDLLGTGEDGLMVVNGAVFQEQFNLMDSINMEKKYLLSLQKRGKARNSDHYWFTERGVPSFFIYTLGGVSYYHDVLDRPQTLPLTEFEDVFRLIVDFVYKLP